MAAEITSAGPGVPRRWAIPAILVLLAAGFGLVVAAPPVALAASQGVASIAVGGQHSCTIRNGKAYCWGYNGEGALGDGTTADSSVPVPVDTSGVLAGKTITQISTGYYDTCALDSTGAAYCWGENTEGELGDNTVSAYSSVPVAVDTSGVLAGKTLTQVSSGNQYTCALASTGTAYCWGLNNWGQLGSNRSTDNTPHPAPAAVDTSGVLAGKTITQISTGYYDTCALDSTGAAYCWGENNVGELGTGSTSTSAQSTPVAVYTGGALASKTLTQVSSGDQYTCALASTGAAYCWGLNTSGQLGDHTTSNRSQPTPVDTSGVLAGKTLAQISAGYEDTCALDASGAAYCWGNGPSGSLGDNSIASSSTPVAVDTSGVLVGRPLTEISAGAGYLHVCAEDSTGAFYCWGNNVTGELGDGTGFSRLVPVRVTPQAPTGVTATAGNATAAVSWKAPVFLFGGAVTGYTATASPGSETCSTTGAASCAISGLTNGTTYSITVVAHTTVGDSGTSTPVTVVPWSQCPCSLWPATAQPTVASANETGAVNLGVQFTPSVNGSIAGIRFYKGTGNTGTHTGELWTASGTLLGQVTFTGESASGWQEADFSSPIAVTAGTTYVASYFAPNGGYSADSAFFANKGVMNGPLTAPQSSAVTPGNGLYAYGSSPAFPSSTYNANNYWVDVVFTMPSGGSASAPTVTGATPDSGSSGNPVTVAPTATFSQAVVPSSVSFTVKDSGGNAANGSVSLDSSSTVATFTPSSPLAPDTTYTATVSGALASSGGGTMSGSYSWPFTTAGSQCPCSLWPSTARATVANSNDPSSGNLGVQFTPAANGWIAGIRFYKGTGNTGTHTGELWTASGTLLGKVTFTGESASGWQEADFSSPIAVTAGTTYVASYFAPKGDYSYTGAGLASTVTNGPLTAPASSSVSPGNGVYNYSGSPSFPSGTYNAANYWVDVVFTQS